MCLLLRFEMAPEDVTAERARVPPVRDKFSRLNPRTLSGRRRTGKDLQTSQTTIVDQSEQQESMEQVCRLHFQIKSDLLAYLHAAVLSLQKNHVSQITDESAIWRKSDLDLCCDLSLLQCTEPQHVDLEGIPNSATSKEVAEYLQNIDPQLDITYCSKNFDQASCNTT